MITFMTIDFQTYLACLDVQNYFYENRSKFETGMAARAKNAVEKIFTLPIIGEKGDAKEYDIPLLMLCNVIQIQAARLLALSFEDPTGNYTRGVTLLNQVCSVALADVPTAQLTGEAA